MNALLFGASPPRGSSGWHIIAALLVTAPLAAQRMEPVPYLTAGELSSGLFIPPRNERSFDASPDGKYLYIANNQGAGIWNVETSTGEDVSRPGERWNFYRRANYAYLPDGRRLVALAQLDGKPWLVQRDLMTGEREKLIELHKDMRWSSSSVIAVTPDGKGAYLRLVQWLERERAHPGDDRPVTESLRTTLRVSPHYEERIDRQRIKRRYAGAIAEETREYVVYFDFETKNLRRVFTGNDITEIIFSPDQQRLVAVQGRPHFISPGIQDYLTQSWADLYLVEFADPRQLPLIDLATAKEEERDAGWFDSAGNRIAPIAVDVGVPRYAETGIVWSPDGTKFVVPECGAQTQGDLIMIDARKRERRNLTRDFDSMRVPARGDEPMAQRIMRTGSARFHKRPLISWRSDSQAIRFAAKGHLWSIALPSGEIQKLSEGNAVIVDVLANVPGLDDSVLIRTTNPASQHDSVARFDIAARRLTSIVDIGMPIHTWHFDAANRRLFFSAADSRSPLQIHVCGIEPGDKPRQLTSFQAELRGRPVPESELLKFVTKAGRIGWAILYYPPGARKSATWPLVVTSQLPTADLVTGDILTEWRSQGWHIMPHWVQAFTRSGYAVLSLDVPLVTPGRQDELRERVVEAFQAATDAAIMTGRVDAKRLAIVEQLQSRGFPEIVIGATDRYSAAAIAGDGASLTRLALDESLQPTAITGTHARVAHQSRLAGFFHETPDAYHRNSGLTYAADAKTPLLVFHQQGPRTPWSEMFAALQPTGIKSIAVAGQGDRLRRILAWLNEHLRGGPSIAGRADLPEARAADLIEVPDDAPALEFELEQPAVSGTP